VLLYGGKTFLGRDNRTRHPDDGSPTQFEICDIALAFKYGWTNTPPGQVIHHEQHLGGPENQGAS
jgi:hypothetical protein